MLWVYDRVRKKRYEARPENICVQNALYETSWEDANERLGQYVLPNNIEKTFSRYETEFSQCIKYLKHVLIPDQNEHALICNKDNRLLLARFIANLMLRNPKTMEQYNLSEVSEEWMNNDEIKTICEMLDEMGLGGGQSLIKATQMQGVLTEEFEYGEVADLIRTVSALPFAFFYTKQGCFITSDFPVSFCEVKSIDANNRDSFFLPITKQTAVLYGNYAGLRKNRMHKIEKSIVDEFNRVYQNGRDLLICSSEEQREQVAREYSGGRNNG